MDEGRDSLPVPERQRPRWAPRAGGALKRRHHLACRESRAHLRPAEVIGSHVKTDVWSAGGVGCHYKEIPEVPASRYGL